MKIVFMGTPDFAVPALEAIKNAGHQVLLCVTQPDRPKGRGGAVTMPPVKEKAISLGIPVYQPERIRQDEAFFQRLRELSPDCIVVAAFGQILPKRILDLPRYGCINIHGSILPRYRGAAPIQWAVINGDKESGVTIMQMAEGLDTGDMLDVARLPLSADETGGSLFDKLSQLGARRIIAVLDALEKGGVHAVPQPEEGVTYAGKMEKNMGLIDWSKDARSIERLIRGCTPWPGTFSYLKGKMLKIWEAEVPEDSAEEKERTLPGTVKAAAKGNFLVQTGNGVLRLLSVQPEGKKRMDTEAYLRGNPVEEGSVFADGPKAR